MTSPADFLRALDRVWPSKGIAYIMAVNENNTMYQDVPFDHALEGFRTLLPALADVVEAALQSYDPDDPSEDVGRLDAALGRLNAAVSALQRRLPGESRALLSRLETIAEAALECVSSNAQGANHRRLAKVLARNGYRERVARIYATYEKMRAEVLEDTP